MSNGTRGLILLQLWRKSKVFTPKFLVKAVCNSQICPPTLVTSLKILLDTLQECKRNLPPKLFISHNKVGYAQLHQPQYKILSETIILHSFLPAPSMHTSNNKLRWLPTDFISSWWWVGVDKVFTQTNLQNLCLEFLLSFPEAMGRLSHNVD